VRTSLSQRSSRNGLVIYFLRNNVAKQRRHKRLHRKFNDLRKIKAPRDGDTKVVEKLLNVSPVMGRH
jgi:hypothetical protein